MPSINKEQRETITVTVQYEVKITATGATHDKRKQCAESLAGTQLTKSIGCKLISAKAKE
jgi:hypothetical protein